MSRTHKTAPTRVKIKNRPKEYHDHTNGVCDLPTLEEFLKNPEARAWKHKACSWETDWHNPLMRCGCSMCDGTYWTSDPAGRLKAKKEIREGLKDFIAEKEEG